VLHPSRTAEGKRRGGHTWRMLVAGEGLDEDVTNGTAALQSPPLGKEEQRRRGSQGGESPREGEGYEPEVRSP